MWSLFHVVLSLAKNQGLLVRKKKRTDMQGNQQVSALYVGTEKSTDVPIQHNSGK